MLLAKESEYNCLKNKKPLQLIFPDLSMVDTLAWLSEEKCMGRHTYRDPASAYQWDWREKGGKYRSWEEG